MGKDFDKIQDLLLKMIPKIEGTSIKKKTITVRDKNFRGFYKEVNKLMGVNAFKFLPNYKIILYDGVKQDYNKISLRNKDKKYKTKTKVLVNDKGLIESINERSNDLFNYNIHSHKFFTYDDDGFILEFVHDDGFGHILTYNIISDIDGNILQIDNHLNSICNHNLPEEELVFRTKKLKDLMYLSSIYMVDMLANSVNEDLWRS